MLSLRPSAEPVSAVAERMGRDEKELGERLYDMSKRGLILRFRASEEQVLYFLAPWVVGMWEFQLKNLNGENIQRYEKYHNEAMVPERRRSKTAGFRVIPVEEEVQADPEVETSEKVSEIIESSTRFAVADCICRKEAEMFGHACDRLMEACMMFDMAADYYIENELAREITKEEARPDTREGRGRRPGPSFVEPSGKEDVHLQLLRLLLQGAGPCHQTRQPRRHRQIELLRRHRPGRVHLL